jgi:hypothetical protein
VSIRVVRGQLAGKPFGVREGTEEGDETGHNPVVARSRTMVS